MIACADTFGVAAPLDQLHSQFLQILPRIETHARIRFGYLRCPGRRADAIAETIAVSWQWFLRLTQQGKDVNDFVATLADFAVRHVRCGRRLCGQERSKDVLSPRAQYRHGFGVETLDCSIRRSLAELLSDPRGQNRLDAHEERLRDNLQSPVPEQAAFRIDFAGWLAQMASRDRTIIEDMTLDLSTQELARKFQISPGRISQKRRAFQTGWLRFHGEPVVG